jgi:hypothetical protein
VHLHQPTHETFVPDQNILRPDITASSRSPSWRNLVE